MQITELFNGLDELFYLLSFRCQIVIKVCEDANKLSVDDSTCPECDARLLNVAYREVFDLKSEKKKLILNYYL